jgi:PhnB protein
MTTADNKPIFAPQLFIPSGVKDISFYLNAFGAKETIKFLNDDGTVHVVELSINGTIFHLHEEGVQKGRLTPNEANGITTLIGLFVEDVELVMNNALKAGATLLNPVQDYDYGYRQGDIMDPFGHQWMIEKKI